MTTCTEKKEVQFINYNNTLDSLELVYSNSESGEREIDLCLLFNINSWDSIAFVLPYVPFKEFDKMNFCNANAVRDTMKYVANVDWNNGLLFIKNNCIIGYSVIGGNPSFSFIDGYNGKAIPILKRSQCKVKLTNTRTDSGEQSFYFIPLVLSDEDQELYGEAKKRLQKADSIKD